MLELRADRGAMLRRQLHQSFGRAASRFATNEYSFFVQDELAVVVSRDVEPRSPIRIPATPQATGSQSAVKPSRRDLRAWSRRRSFPSDTNEFEPRLGFAYDVRGTGRTMIRGGYGIYHGRIPNGIICDCHPARALHSLKAHFNSIRQQASAAPVFPDTFAESAECGGVPKHRRVRSEHPASLRPSRSIWYSSMISGRIPSFRRHICSTAGRNLPTFIDVNLPAPTSRTYAIVGGDFDGQTLTVSPVL